MILLDTGKKIQLHIHNVKFEDATKEIVVDAAAETYFIGIDRVSYYWIHKEGYGEKNNCKNISTYIVYDSKKTPFQSFTKQS